MSEQWKDIECAAKGRYQVSDRGRIRSVPEARTHPQGRFCNRPDNEMAPQPDPNGYLKVRLLVCPSRYRTFSVHRLVAEAFVPGKGESVNHIDGIKANNTPANLEWVSLAENTRHGMEMYKARHGRHQSPRGTESPGARLCDDDVRCLRIRHERGETIASLAREYGVSETVVRKVVQRKRWRHVA